MGGGIFYGVLALGLVAAGDLGEPWVMGQGHDTRKTHEYFNFPSKICYFLGRGGAHLGDKV